MVSFYRQLKFLLWKCFLVKKRQKFWLVTELFVPCILFIIIALIRTKDFNVTNTQCHYDSKGMPSAGLLPFIHSFFCSLSNQCNIVPTNDDELEFLFNPAFNGTAFNGTASHNNESLAVDFLYYSSLQLQYIGEHPQNFQQTVEAVADLIHLVANMKMSKNGLFQIKDMFDSTTLKQLRQSIVENGVSDETVGMFLEAWIRLGSIAAVLQTKESLEDRRLLSPFSTADFQFSATRLFSRTAFYFPPDYDFGPEKIGELCKNLDAFSMDNISSILVKSSFENGKPFTFGSDRGRMKTLDILNKLESLRIFSMDQPIFRFYEKYGNTAWQDLKLALFCGKDPFDLLTKSAGSSQNDNDYETPFIKWAKAITRFIAHVTPGSSGSTNGTCFEVPMHQELNCSQLEGSLLLKFQPIFSGYILVTPRNPATERLVERLNRPLKLVEYIRNLLYYFPEQAVNLQWAMHNSDLWPASQNVLAWLEETKPPFGSIEMIKLFLQHAFGPPTDPQSLAILFADVISICFLVDRFRFVPNESEMESTAVCLQNQNQYFSGIVFDMKPNATKFNAFVSYQIRHYADYVDGTSYVTDSLGNPFTRARPMEDLKYLFFGFSFLQEAIDRALIEENSKTAVEVGAYAQQEPYPCAFKDTFNVTLFMPLFMLLSFLIPSSLLVKNIVYEKELRIKEQMRIMGLGESLHLVSWAIVALVLNFISILIIAFILKYARIFNHTDFSLLLAVLFLFMCSGIAMSLFFSTLFTNANISTAATCILWFIFYFPFQLKRDGNMSFWMSSTLLLPPTSMGYAFSILASYNAVEKATWAAVPEMVVKGTDLGMPKCMIFLGVDTIMFLILAWYISNVAPGKYGVRLPLYFPFTLHYWYPKYLRNRVEIDDDYNFDTIPALDRFETEPQGLKVTVNINSMAKVYSNGTKALDSLNLRLYENHITALLGHNGAGKTTTMSLLCGLYSPSHGTAKVYGHDIRKDLTGVRSVLGVCPQHNVLFTHLTVSEQLELFAALKGVADKDLKKEVSEVLESVSLLAKANKLAGTLSGGMKRRLCIGIALIGGSKFVILDEPTAGVDVTARKDIWRLLQRNKTGRTILLSTHHMDEADVLSDRIAILSEGELITLGSSVYLKRRFGEYMTLTIIKNSSKNYEEAVAQIISEAPFEIAFSTENDDEIVFKIPITTDSKELEAFFADLDTKLLLLDFGRYGISAPNSSLRWPPQREYIIPKKTSWEAFKKWKNNLCRKRTPDVENRDLIPSASNLETIAGNNDVGSSSRTLAVKTSDSEDVNSIEEMEKPSMITGWRLWFQHVRALLSCRLHYSLRSKRLILFEVVIPILLLFACELFVNMMRTKAGNGTIIIVQGAMPLETSLYGDFVDAYVSSHDRSLNSTATELLHSMLDSPGFGTRCAYDEPAYVRYARSCYEKMGEFNYTRSLDKVPFNEDILCNCTNYGWDCALEDWPWGETPWLMLNTTDRVFDLSGRNISQFRMVTHLQTVANATAPYFVGGFSLGHKNLRAATKEQINDQKEGWQQFKQGWNTTKSTLGINTTHQEEPRIVDPFVVNVTGDDVVNAILGHLDTRENVKVWFNNKVWPSLPIYSNTLSNAILRLGTNDTEARQLGILAATHPMNQTAKEAVEENTKYNMKLLVFRVTLLMLVLGIIPAGFTVYLVEDRICDAFHLQLVGGLHRRTYWVTSFFFDALFYTVAIAILMGVYAFMKVNEFTYSRGTFVSLALVFWLFGLSAILYAYCMQRFFTIPALSFVLIAIGTFFVGIVCTLTVIVLEGMIPSDVTLLPTYTICSFVFLLLPQYNLGMAIFRSASVYQVRELGVHFLQVINREDLVVDLPLPADMAWDVMGLHSAVLLLHIFLAAALLVFCEMDQFQFMMRNERARTQKLLDKDSKLEDEDVHNEQLRVDQISATEGGQALVVRRLAKAYGKENLAVRGISFAVEPGECFGLLGLNGAGKTTTFAMLTAKMYPGLGSIDVNGCSVTSGNLDGFKQLGYCPQFDALNSKLTTRQNLTFYARIRGIPEKEIFPIVDRLLKSLHLRPYAKIVTSQLSGGNRRKLSVAVALISQPSLIFLDEPSAGMDPGSQQFLWNVIERLCKAGKAVVLTSHSMEECEALCTRIAIMDKGKIRCLGGKQHLKNKYGKGYSLTLKLTHISEANIAAEYIHERIIGSRIESIHCSTVFIHVDQDKSTIANILKIVNEAKEKFSLEDYNLSQSTLDEVFQGLTEHEWNLSGVAMPVDTVVNATGPNDVSTKSESAYVTV
ncbi:unnamed protein product [Caenorhabditis auriculariae]|uniref:ABC transporter domain-containing protein n=1 Tax=Caenorhabditis auriculariae TaxID=2777116 RepID=A0A8S1H6A6_9PELO|nr:unnamed protein product [Caenorhabditis auriculariae]